MDAYCRNLGKTDCDKSLTEETLLPYARYDSVIGKYYCYEDVNTKRPHPLQHHCRAPGYNSAECFEGSGAKCYKDTDLREITKKKCSGNFHSHSINLKSIIRFD